MAKGMFDAASFMSNQITQELDTVVIPCPEGDHVGMITKLDVRPWVKKDDPTINGVNLDVFVKVRGEDILAECGVEEVTVKGGVGLDIDEAGTGLATGKGKNVRLGKLLEAAGLNNGESSINDLLNQPILVRVIHEIVDEETYAKISRFANPSEIEE